jgi:hypothetical protein
VSETKPVRPGLQTNDQRRELRWGGPPLLRLPGVLTHRPLPVDLVQRSALTFVVTGSFLRRPDPRSLTRPSQIFIDVTTRLVLAFEVLQGGVNAATSRRIRAIGSPATRPRPAKRPAWEPRSRRPADGCHTSCPSRRSPTRWPSFGRPARIMRARLGESRSRDGGRRGGRE